MITGQKIFSLLKALAVSYIITAILLLVTALLMYKLGLGETAIHLSIIIIHGISVFLGGFLTGKDGEGAKVYLGIDARSVLCAGDRYCIFHYERYDPHLCRRNINECDPVSRSRNAWRNARLETSFS